MSVLDNILMDIQETEHCRLYPLIDAEVTKLVQIKFNELCSSMMQTTGWQQHSVPLSIGDRIKQKSTGWECEVNYIETTRIGVIYYPPGRPSFVASVAMVDIWNYYSMWPGTNDPPVTKPACEHKFVNVSFAGLNMRCKYCDKSEEECKAASNKDKLGGYSIDGY